MKEHYKYLRKLYSDHLAGKENDQPNSDEAGPSHAGPSNGEHNAKRGRGRPPGSKSKKCESDGGGGDTSEDEYAPANFQGAIEQRTVAKRSRRS